MRLIFEEFFFYQLSVAMRKKAAQQQTGIAFRVREPAIREAIKRVLPFKPTGAQKRALAEIAADLERGVPMNRLLQGDVGSGKTVVAALAAAQAIDSGFQAALMAPTEVLARQHDLDSVRTVIGRHAGTLYDPHLTSALLDNLDVLLSDLDDTASWEGVLAADEFPGSARSELL